LWLRLSYWVVVLVGLAAFAFAALGRIGDYASGPAVVVAPAHDELRAEVAGELGAVDVALGQRVSAGQRVATLRANGADVALSAPTSGVVGRLDARPGQTLRPGDGVLDLLADDAPREITAFLPADHRDLLHPGMLLRFHPRGDGATTTLTIDAVAEELVDAASASRYLGGAGPSGPSVQVRARLPAGASWPPGTSGVADVRTRSQRILAVLFPSLDATGRP
jgi:multidrug efflux pump subunit AcrA (membrane-fusion protein)